eukprot:12026069-Ditylum_brightwellii.AAC.1
MASTESSNQKKEPHDSSELSDDSKNSTSGTEINSSNVSSHSSSNTINTKMIPLKEEKCEKRHSSDVSYSSIRIKTAKSSERIDSLRKLRNLSKEAMASTGSSNQKKEPDDSSEFSDSKKATNATESVHIVIRGPVFNEVEVCLNREEEFFQILPRKKIEDTSINRSETIPDDDDDDDVNINSGSETVLNVSSTKPRCVVPKGSSESVKSDNQDGSGQELPTMGDNIPCMARHAQSNKVKADFMINRANLKDLMSSTCNAISNGEEFIEGNCDILNEMVQNVGPMLQEIPT